jgi:hypothetical protein
MLPPPPELDASPTPVIPASVSTSMNTHVRGANPGTTTRGSHILMSAIFTVGSFVIALARNN